MTDLYETMSTLRAVRKLRTDPIPDDVLERVLQAACWAPTGGNQQPWRVIVVTDPAKKAGLQEIYEPQWRRYIDGMAARMAALSPDDLEQRNRVTAAGDHLAAHLHEAPAILMFCADPKMMAITDAKLDRISMVGGGSVYPAVQNAMLACVAEGLGCTLTTLHCLKEAEVKELLDVPDGWATVAMVPIGYPVGRGHGPITRQPPSVLAYRDTFGSAWS
ncbi:MAG: nitroreductase family protein [Ilumatobacteraceae bacterium]|nr:nitroreductase family protein [Ilumatobacteraceae bacterium]